MKRVLIVDDDDGFREALGTALTLHRFHVEEARSGREAMERLSRRPPLPDALLIDLMMPDMNGWELLDLLARDPDLARIPSAVVSAARLPTGLPASVQVLPKASLATVLRFLEESGRSTERVMAQKE